VHHVDIHRFDLDSRGLARVLGELEARIMEAVWRLGAPTINDIVEALDPPPHYKTALTVANRLVQKGLLSREPTADRAFAYRAVEEREVFLQRISATVASGLVGDFGHHALAQFVRAAGEVDPAYLDELQRLVRQHKGVE
jgi:predicted transcriptional regulator